MHNQSISDTSASIRFSGSNNSDLEDNSIQRAFKNAKHVVTSNNGLPETAKTAMDLVIDPIVEQGANSTGPDIKLSNPIVPLGHNANVYYFISPSSQLRNMKAEALEAGRGVQSLFLGMGDDTIEWCRSMFPARDNGWSSKDAGLWIIEQCNAAGVFDPSRVDLRSAGVWRDDKGHATAHCVDRLIYASDKVEFPASSPKNFILNGAPKLDPSFLSFFVGLTRWWRSEFSASLNQASVARDRCTQ